MKTIIDYNTLIDVVKSIPINEKIKLTFNNYNIPISCRYFAYSNHNIVVILDANSDTICCALKQLTVLEYNNMSFFII